MFCRKCGNQVNEGDKFCARCGAAVVAQAEASVEKAAPQAEEETSASIAVTTAEQKENPVLAFWNKTTARVKELWSKPVGKIMRKLCVAAGLLFLVQFVFLFLPMAKVEIIVPLKPKLSGTEYPMLLAVAFIKGGFDGVLAVAALGTTFIAAFCCFSVKNHKLIGTKRKIFIVAVGCIHILLTITCMTSVSAVVAEAIAEAELQAGSRIVEGNASLNVVAWLGLLVSLAQTALVLLIALKSKQYNEEMESLPEIRLAKLKKLLDDGVLTKEEFDEKTKEILNVTK